MTISSSRSKKPSKISAKTSSGKKAPAKKSAKKKPAAKKTATKKAAAKKAVKKPAAKKPAVKKPAVKKPAVKKPAAKKPAAKKPVAKKAAAKKVAPKKAAAKKAVAKKSPAESRSRAALAKQAAASGVAAQSGAVVNHVAFVVDRSGSMSSIRAKVVQVFNAQLGAVKSNSDSLGQTTFVSFYTFHSTVDAPRFFAQPIKDVEKLKSISTTGSTALFDATGQVIVDLEGVPGAERDNVSFLVIVLTDGYENSSRRYKSKIKSMLQRAQGTGRWTFAFLVPKGGESVLKRFGIPGGNIQAWQTSNKGLQDLQQDLQQGLQNYYQARQKGERAVVGVFTTNMKDVSVDKVKAELKDASGDFVRIAVKDGGAIRPLVEAERVGEAYKKGHGYYELTKPELVQEYKEIAIVDNKSGNIFSGDAARTLLGLPIGERIKVKPGEHGDFSIFVQSTSVNRQLVKGTTLLYKK